MKKRVTAADFANEIRSRLSVWLENRETQAWDYLLKNTSVTLAQLGAAYQVKPQDIDIRVKNFRKKQKKGEKNA